jgi:hypothetical protein
VTEAGPSWHLWLRTSLHTYTFRSMENALRFACSLPCTRARAICVTAQRSLEQGATLI